MTMRKKRITRNITNLSLSLILLVGSPPVMMKTTKYKLDLTACVEKQNYRSIFSKYIGVLTL